MTPQKTNKKHTAHLQVVRRQERAIWITAIVIAVLVIGIVAYGILSETVFLPYRAVATVNGDSIRAGDFQKQVKLQRLQLVNQFNQYYQFSQMFGSTDPMSDPNFGQTLQQIYQQLNTPTVVGQNVLDYLIEDKLIRQEAARLGITVSAADVEQAMQEGLGYYANGTPTPAPTATAFLTPTLNPTALSIVTITPTSTPVTPAPTATPDPNITPTETPSPFPTATTGPTATPLPTATPYTLEGYNTLFDEQIKFLTEKTGMTREDYRKFYEGIVLREKLLEAVTKDLSASAEKVWARHILVSDETLAKAVSEKLKAGADFGQMAAEFSLDTSNKDRGGDLGWFGKGMMVAPFEEAVFSLSPGQISEPVQTEYGWHIIQLVAREMTPLGVDEFEQYKQRFFTDFLKELRGKAEITTNDAFWKEIVPTEPALQ